METLLVYVALGIGAGLLAGMLGVGGGQVVVPGLLYLFQLHQFPDAHLVHLALGTSLATIAVTSLASAWSHYRLGSLSMSATKSMAPGIVVGALLGGLMSGLFPSHVLKTGFGVFLILLALQMAFSLKPSPGRDLPGPWGASFASGVIGWVSAIVGVGGGSMVVPYLTWCNIPMKTAVGTASACGFFLAVAGMGGYIVAGWGAPDLPPYSVGYVYLPAWLAVSALSILFTRVGAGLAHRLPVSTLKRIFSICLLLAGVRILM
ncbi:sulfite exporter TauE/SafE family protein [Diaphorobacter sp.]|uniref:sulfite exporter TauE/SafE family protein n=1 Tax=Diaphorobacter sp. TaxID=1934310 RepID=UPI0028A70174|nr:sulfite exporter TauE/SafE family protein [Diaphorobacter sp.]